ncbi:MAG: hypothetical protein RI946_2129 [Pseudomonadota bacterium]|jgi:hypothetical protein
MLAFSDPDQYVLSTQRWQCSTMISYSLKCDNDHTFDSWFASADAFDKLSGADMVTCNICGSTKVQKAIMAPRVSTGKTEETTPLMAPDDHTARAIQEMRKKIEANSDYVGKNFAAEARKMHLGDAPERSIYGEAKPEEAKSLIEDGINVVPLPFMPNRKTN